MPVCVECVSGAHLREVDLFLLLPSNFAKQPPLLWCSPVLVSCVKSNDALFSSRASTSAFTAAPAPLSGCQQSGFTSVTAVKTLPEAIITKHAVRKTSFSFPSLFLLVNDQEADKNRLPPWMQEP